MCQVKDNKIDVTALLPSILPHLSTQAIVQYQYSIVQYSIVQYSIISSELPFHSEKTTDCKKQPVKLVALHLQQLQGQKLKTPGSPTTTFYVSIIKTQVEKKKKCLIFKHLGHKKTIILAGFVTPTSMLPCLPLKESAYASPRVEAT